MRLYLYLLILLTSSASSFAKTLNIPGKASDDKLAISLVKEMVNRSDIYDRVHFYYGEAGDPPLTKMTADLELGHIDIAWSGTTSQFEQEMQAIYFPIYRGMLGMRLPIVERNKSTIFSHVNTWAQFTQYVACQGKAWPDTTILEANGLTVAKSLKYPNMFPMLEGDRCDYFPRGVFEPFQEIKIQSQYDLVVDTHVMLRYKMPYYLFTKKSNTGLSDHITEIFTEMYRDGTFQALFFADHEVRQALNLGGLSERVIFDLENPDLTKQTKSIPTVYWFDPIKGQ